MQTLTAPALSLVIAVSLRFADGLSWDVLLRAIIATTVVVWIGAVATTLWCVFAPCWERRSADGAAVERAAQKPATS